MTEHITIASELRIGDKLYNPSAKNDAFQWLRICGLTKSEKTVHVQMTCWDTTLPLDETPIKVKRSVERN